MHRALARHPRRADQLRPQARRHGVRAGPRPRTAAARAGGRERRRRSAASSARTRAVDPRVEELVCARLGLRPARRATQVIQRDRHAEFVTALAITASTLDRDRDRDPAPGADRGPRGAGAVRRRAEGLERDAAQAEPGGLASGSAGWRACSAGHAQAALENMPLWHERDISHSSAERVILPDATGLLAFMLTRHDVGDRRARTSIPTRMRENLEAARRASFFSQKVLPGARGPRAWRVTRRTRSSSGRRRRRGTDGRRFRGPDVGRDRRHRRRSPRTRSRRCSRSSRYLANLGGVFERLEKLPVEAAVSADAVAARPGARSATSTKRATTGC